MTERFPPDSLLNEDGQKAIREIEARHPATPEDYVAVRDLRDRILETRLEPIGDRFMLPPQLLALGMAHQFVRLEEIDHMRAGGWSPTRYDPVIWEGWPIPYEITIQGFVKMGGLILMEKPKADAALSAEDERVKPLVIEAIARRALGCAYALSDRNIVRKAFEEAKAAYDDTAFRNANRDAIIERAKRLASRAGQTPELMVSTEPPVPCRLEGIALWFFNYQRLLPVWRLFEPLAIVQVREEMQEKAK